MLYNKSRTGCPEDVLQDKLLHQNVLSTDVSMSQIDKYNFQWGKSKFTIKSCVGWFKSWLDIKLDAVTKLN